MWHLWNTPDLFDEIERESHRFLGVHINDYRSPTRGFADRVLPGDGVADVASILRALDRTGWTGFYDLEVFSDNGAWGTVYPDALWDVPPTLRGCSPEALDGVRRARGRSRCLRSRSRSPACCFRNQIRPQSVPVSTPVRQICGG